MKFVINEMNGVTYSEVFSDEIVINETQDALDLMAESMFNGAEAIVIHEKNIVPGFFDLTTGIAGEVLQKFSTYGVRLAIVGDFSKYTSKSLSDFIFESNKYRHINFVSSVEEAKKRFMK